MMENKIKYGIVGLISLLVAFGGYITLTQEELDNAYYCPSTGEWGVFYGGISGTGLTAYPYSENRTDYERCINSKWVKLTDYAEELGLDSSELMQQKPSGQEIGTWGKQYSCNQINCSIKN